MKPQHTKGKWELLKISEPIEGLGFFMIRSDQAPGGIAVSVGGLGEEEAYNMKLFYAAPDLLEACKHAAMSNHHQACKCKGEYAANPEMYCTCHVYKAQAAFAKASTTNHVASSRPRALPL